MDEAEFKMFYRGLPAKLRHTIYNCFEPEKHVIPAFGIPTGWPRGMIGLDPVGEKVAALWLAFDPAKSQLHVYREYEGEFGATTQGHTAEILKHVAEDKMLLKVVGGGPTERQARVDFNGAGLV